MGSVETSLSQHPLTAFAIAKCYSEIIPHLAKVQIEK